MPLYEYKCKCPECFKRFERVLPLAEYDKIQSCPECGQPALKQLSASQISMDYQPYHCPITGKYIDGKRAHKENLAKHGMRVFEQGEQEDSARFRRDADRELDKNLEKTAEKLISKLPPEKFKQLEHEANSGLIPTIERR